jgi:hypothetical protein
MHPEANAGAARTKWTVCPGSDILPAGAGSTGGA